MFNCLVLSLETVFFIIGLSFLGLKTACCVNQTFLHGSSTSHISGHICPLLDIVEEVYLESDLQCSYKCSSDVTCGSFFYQHDDKVCVTCTNVYLDTGRLDVFVGMEYYIPEADFVPVGRWNDWTAWTACSASCAGGTRTRTRTCNDTVDPCVGDSLNIDTCNMNRCSPDASTCAEWASLGLDESRTMRIDPDGNGTVFHSVAVECDLHSEPGKAITVLHHNQEVRTEVLGYESCRSYERVLGYMIGFDATEKVVDISTGCKQYIKWECYKAFIYTQTTGNVCTGWTNRSGITSSYFTGPYDSAQHCECGDQGTCIYAGWQCNCDTQVNYVTHDEGYIYDKDALPMYSFVAGDTGATGEVGYHTIGPILCW